MRNNWEMDEKGEASLLREGKLSCDKEVFAIR